MYLNIPQKHLKRRKITLITAYASATDAKVPAEEV